MKIIKHKLLLIFLIVTGLFLVLAGGIILNNASELPSQLVVHFDSFNGIDMFGSYADLWIIWVMGFVFAIINAILAEEFFHKNKVLSYIFLGADVLISLFILIIVSTIISVS